MEKKKTIAQGMGQMSKSLGKWDDEGRRDRQMVVARGQGTRRTTFKDEEGSTSPPSAADRRGRLRAEEEEASLVNTVKAFAGKTSETVDKYEEARKKSKINRFFKGVRNIFPKGKKKSDKKKSKGGDAASSDSEGDGASSSSSKKRYAKEEKRKEREIGGGKFQEKERKRREEEERKRQSELEDRRKQRRASAAGDEDEDESRNNKSSEGEDQLEDRRQMRKQEHLLKRAQSAPSPAKLEKDESSDRPHGIREKYRAKLEAKKAAALAELNKEEAEKEQAKQRQAAKAEEAAIDSFLERAAQRRRGTEERVGFRSKRASLDRGLSAPLQPSGEEDEEDDEHAARRRRLGLATAKKENGTSSTSTKRKKEEEKGKEVVRTASARTHKKVVPTRGHSEPQTMSGSMGGLATSAAIGGAKLVGRYVQQRLVDENADVDRGEKDEDEEGVEEEEEEVERAHRWKDRERARKVNERIEETRRQRQAQAQGRRPSLGKSYSWASPRSGDIPVPLSSRDRMTAAIEGAAARNNNNNGSVGSTSSRASPSRAHAGANANGNGGSGDRTLWHKKARVIRERSQRNLGGSGGGASRGDVRTTSERRLN